MENLAPFLKYINPKPTGDSRTLLTVATRLTIICRGISAVEYIQTTGPKLSVPRCRDLLLNRRGFRWSGPGPASFLDQVE